MTDDFVVAGIPSFREEATIAHVVTQVDRGLSALGPDVRAVIVNADNGSPDGTRAAFESTPTRAGKVYLPTPPGVRGKGHNVANLLRYAVDHDAAALVIVDADLESITADWVPRLAGPVLAGDADFVTPRYATSQGGPLRHLICRPLVTGLFAADVEQPTGGEFAFSAGRLRALAATPLPPAADAYGIDIFLTTEAAAAGARLWTVDLGRKVHRTRPWDAITHIAVQVARTAFAQLARHRAALAARAGVVVPGGPPPGPEGAPLRAVSADELDGLLEHYRAGAPGFTGLYREALGDRLTGELLTPRPGGVPREAWLPALYGLARHAVGHPGRADECAAALMPLFEGRMVSYAAELRDGVPPVASGELFARRAEVLGGSRTVSPNVD